MKGFNFSNWIGLFFIILGVIGFLGAVGYLGYISFISLEICIANKILLGSFISAILGIILIGYVK